MEKKIMIKGEEITIKFNMGVECAYEDITQRPFNLADFKDKKLLMALFHAAIITNNPKTEITFDYLLTDATCEEVTALDNAVSETMSDWLHIPAVIKKDEPKPKDQEEQPKN